MSAPLAALEHEWRGSVAVARLQGEVDASNADELAARLRRLLGNRAHGLVVDLRATTYLDSAGINLLFALGADLRAKRQELRLVLPQGSPIARMLAITALDRAFPVHPTVDAAVEGAEAAGRRE